MSEPLVIGVGNPLRGDDAVGPRAAAALAARGWRARTHPGDGAALIAALEGEHEVVLVDACQSGAPPGTIHRFDAASQPLPARFFRASSHAFGLAEAIETARALGLLPARVLVYAVEGARFGFGDPLTPAVEAALAGLIETLGS